MHKAIQRTGANTYMPRKRDLRFSVDGAHKCKIIVLYFNIMSAFATNFLCQAKFRRVFLKFITL